MALCAALILDAAVAMAESAQLHMPAFFSDSMVLQRDMPVPFWGWATPGRTVEVECNGVRAQAKTGSNGRWSLRLAALGAGGPYEVHVSDRATTLTIRDVLVGEVWLCSGQSNMNWQVSRSRNADKEIPAADHPRIRFYTPPMTPRPRPLDDVVDRPGWVVCTPKSVGEFSAIGYYFAREMQSRLGVPFGIIHCSLGSTTVQLWTSREALARLPEFRGEVERIEADLNHPEQAQERYRKDVAAWIEKVEKADGGSSRTREGWQSPEADVSSWKRAELPGIWERAGLSDYDGTVWYRRELNLSPEHVKAELTLHLGSIDDADIVWLNGIKLGFTDSNATKRSYKVPSGTAKAGRNVLAACVIDLGGGGGFTGAPGDMQLEACTGGTSTASSLAGAWHFCPGTRLEKLPQHPLAPDFPWHLGCLYNGMIAPFAGYGMRGVLWYQGESNSPKPGLYERLFPALISDWRSHWGQGDFPFLFVQLPGYIPPPGEDWVGLREAQSKTLLVVGNCAMACAIDLGEATNIHPSNKQGVAGRLALIARGLVYGERIEYSGPVYNSMQRRGDTIAVSFERQGKGLCTHGGGKLKGFAVAGPDRRFVSADAVIEGDHVIVSSPEVKEPVAVRYAWQALPECNLMNGEGLPAAPFRTDAWTEK